LQKISVKIQSKAKVHQGSGSLIKMDKHFYIITAAHCLFEKNELNTNISNIVISSQVYGEIPLDPDCFDIKRPDIDAILLRVSKENTISNFPNLKFTADHIFPGLKFCFRGTAKSVSGKAYTVYNCSMNGSEDNLLDIEIPPESYNDFAGNRGAEVLEGYSGSGLIVQNQDEILFSGIICSISEDNFNGVECISISDIKDCFQLQIPFEDITNTANIVRLDVQSIKDSIAKRFIQYVKDNNNNDAIAHLTRKMDLFLPEWEMQDLENFVSDMLVWDQLYKNKVKGNPDLYSLIKESRCELSSGNKTFYVDSSREGNKQFHLIKKEFKEIIDKFLEDNSVWKKYTNTIASGEIAKYLANCNLNFKE